MDSISSQDSIQVFIRIKPIKQQQSVLAFTQTQIKLDKHQFAFDKIFPPTASQNDIFHHVGNKLLNNVLDGYNSCIFVYGQTGSGKTHTMIGQNNGLMQQSFNELFSRLNRMKNAQCLVTCSYFELYNQQIMDLLEPKKQKKLNIRQDAKKGVFVQNLSEQTALDCDKLMDVLYTGMKNRHIGQTQMNRQSSRSHSVFTISLSCKMQQDGKKILKTPKLHFVDLAGSERQKMTQASGDRLKQAGNINKSLTTLGMVINALTSQKPRNHIPYRDSKLTCLLRDSLGGNSKTIIIATVSSIALSFQQTLSTLNFANRAKMVKVKALINQESLSSNIEVFKQQIRRLKAQIVRLKSEHHRTPIKVITQQLMSPKQIGNELQHHFEQINKKISAISDQINQGITSPSLQALLKNLNKSSKRIVSTETMMDQQQQQNFESDIMLGQVQQKTNPSQFIEYLNSNYELLSEINTKINQYVELKQQLRQTAISKKLTMQSMLTPSKFERDQYQQLLVKRERQIKELESRLEQLEQKLRMVLLQKKDYQRRLQSFNEKKTDSLEQIQRLRNQLIGKQFQLQRQKAQSQRHKSNQYRIQKNINQLEQRYKQTKQLHLYAEQKFQNEKFNNTKLTNKLEQMEKQLNAQKRGNKILKQQIQQKVNMIQNFKMTIQDKQTQQQQLKNQIIQVQQTIEFNKKIIQQLTKKNLSLQNQLNKNHIIIQQINIKYQSLQQQNTSINDKLLSEQLNSTKLIEQKSFALKQSHINNERLSHQLSLLNQQLIQHKQYTEQQLNKNKQTIMSLKQCLNQKESLLNKYVTQNHILSQSIQKIKLQKQSIKQSQHIKYQAKSIECSMLEEQLRSLRKQTQSLIEQHQKQTESNNNKIQYLTIQKQKLQNQLQTLNTKYIQSQKKLSSVQHIINQNEQFKNSYKQLIKQNYRLKGKYQNHNQNQQLQKQKNNQLLSKVQFYQQKFKLMSIQYHKIQSIVKKLKEKQLQSNQKIQFYQENIKLLQLQKSNNKQQDLNQKNTLIYQLKSQNRQLKYKLDSLQSNLNQNQNQNHKKSNQQKQTINLNIKQQKFRLKLSQLMKNWQGYNNKANNQISTEQMIDLCQMMLNQNAIKFQTIAKGIRRQQKLKSQNHFILKQNIYLKQRVQQLQKTQNFNKQKQKQDPKPRKAVKID